jgi:tripartite-type tricarboxylate transporter receptor subunit TctC
MSLFVSRPAGQRTSVGTAALAAALLGLAFAQPASAQATYPEPGKVITIITGASAGSGQDITARLAAEALEKELPGSKFQVVNKTGAGGQVGFQAIADAPNDGYTLGIVPLPNIVNVSIDPERQAKFNRDSYVPVANFIYDPGALAVQADSPYKTLGELVEAARADPKAITAAVTGPRSREHLDVMAVQQVVGATITPVFFSDSGQGMNALLGGSVTAVQGSVGDFLSQVQAGRLRVLAVFDRQASPFMPDVPTADSQGFPIFSGVSRGFAFPKGVPAEAVQVLTEAFGRILKSPERQDAIKAMGFEPRYMSAEEYGKYWDAEVVRITELMAKIVQ